MMDCRRAKEVADVVDELVEEVGGAEEISNRRMRTSMFRSFSCWQMRGMVSNGGGVRVGCMNERQERASPVCCFR